MTSRFAKQFPCLNGPKEGYLIDAPPNAAVGSAVALPWINARMETVYAVYILTEIPKGDSDAPASFGLMFLQSHPTPERAQAHVQQVAYVLNAAYAASQS